MNKLRTGLVILTLLTIHGCLSPPEKPSFTVFVSSLSAGESDQKKNFIILPENKGIDVNDLQFKEYADYLKRLLAAQGYREAKSSKETNIAIFLSYGIGNPEQHVYSYNMPTWGATGVSSSYTTGQASTNGSYTSYSGTTTYTPSYGITGYQSRVGTYTTFTRYVTITGIDYQYFQRTKSLREIWKTELISTGSSGDLRVVFPVMIGASTQYLARQTSGYIQVELYESDSIVKFIKGQVPPTPDEHSSPEL